MTIDAHKNFAVSLVATAPSPASSGTSLVVTAAQGALFPAVPFNATIWPAATQPTTANAEIVRVTAISTDTFTITRAQESSSARTVIVGDQIAATVTNKTFTDIETGYIANTLTTTTGDTIYASAANTPARLAVGSVGDILKTNGTTALPVWGKRRGYYCTVSGTIADTFDRRYIAGGAISAVTATIMMSAIELDAGMVLSNFNIRTAGSGSTAGTNNWMALYDSSRVQLAATADQGLATMTASTAFTWPVATIASGASSTYTVPTTGLYYVGFMFKGTAGNFNGTQGVTVNNAPILYGTSNAAQAGVNAFPFTANALTASSGGFYVWFT